MPTYKELLTINEQRARDYNKEPSAIKLLMLHFSKLSNEKLYASLEEIMPKESQSQFLDAVELHIVKNIPVQHIMGYEHFFGRRFKVNEDVLIPRFETEELLSELLLLYDEVFAGKEVDVVDIGTGSGCLAISLDLEESNMHVTATDISQKALDVAKENNTLLNGSVSFLKGNGLTPLKNHKFDILVSNPPYIPNQEAVDPLVKDNEPAVALFGGEDGLDLYHHILKEAKHYLNERFIIGFEHAYDKKDTLKQLINTYFTDVKIIQKKDMQGKDRMTFIIKQ
ncbi:MAG: peptide chain release factor N(5)-glutamine methyltransferase [Candidatus Izimaplasma sp.]|nr:peptide chain release factor N(5)-glutamine methyltransferase [Candidatus Izimaplasma bacterium]